MATSKLICVELTLEGAYEAAAILQDVEIVRNRESEVHSGEHPEWGSVHIVIPMMGAPLRLLNGCHSGAVQSKTKPLVMSNFDKLKKE